MILSTYEAAGTLLAGVDAFRNERKNVSSRRRVMRGVAVVGGAAVDDTIVDLYIEDFFVGTFRNTHAGAVGIVVNQDVIPVGPHYIPPGSKLAAIMAANCGAGFLKIQLY
ncbi:unnamed protein product [marine sediment metagenome]|uniref:Uncharacterized protein n=1 Tax=marine sediment metagenome TaxID=412755 RepID=X1K1D0_9ZZZZ